MIIAVSPSIEGLAVEGGLKASTLHITLAYIGKTAKVSLEEFSKVQEACIKLGEMFNPFEIRLNNISRFENVRKMTDVDGLVKDAEEPTDVIFLTGDFGETSILRAELIKILDGLGCNYSKLHPEFTPHISIKYVPHGENFEYPYSLPISFTVNDVQVWTDTDKYKYPLRGANVKPIL